MKLHTLHGFLGAPNDWDFLDASQFDVEIVNHDLFHDQPICAFSEWSKKFNSYIPDKAPALILGYSLGGRLAMNVLLDAPKLWAGAIIVSAHLGLFSRIEKNARCQSDGVWADRFRKEPWDQLMHDWNAREMFTTASFSFKRLEENYDRECLAQAIDTWSLGHQQEMTQHLSELDIPILWVAGENDMTYSARAHRVTFKHPLSSVWVAPNSGHRVPWEKQEAFLKHLQHFLNDIRMYHDKHTICSMGNC